MSQKDIFLASEGDAYFNRNRNRFEAHDDLLVSALTRLQIEPRRILEIGCSEGYRLSRLRKSFGTECHGIDPSKAAIDSSPFPDLRLKVGTADKLDYSDGFFDLVLFGHCLYLCDPQDHFTIAAEANRVLADGGFIGLTDFLPARPHRNPYGHRPGIFSYKMTYANMFLWHPSYRLLSRTYCEHAEKPSYDPSTSITLDLIRKDLGPAFPIG
jgi:SAM-dependent methyltransferase